MWNRLLLRAQIKGCKMKTTNLSYQSMRRRTGASVTLIWLYLIRSSTWSLFCWFFWTLWFWAWTLSTSPRNRLQPLRISITSFKWFSSSRWLSRFLDLGFANTYETRITGWMLSSSSHQELNSSCNSLVTLKWQTEPWQPYVVSDYWECLSWQGAGQLSAIFYAGYTKLFRLPSCLWCFLSCSCSSLCWWVWSFTLMKFTSTSMESPSQLAKAFHPVPTLIRQWMPSQPYLLLLSVMIGIQ